jgi:hypothetical protein
MSWEGDEKEVLLGNWRKISSYYEDEEGGRRIQKEEEQQ